MAGEKDVFKVVCPFFCGLSGHTICCEGIIPDTRTYTSFGSERRLKRYRRSYCDTFSYGQCPLCVVLEKKYE